jgi:transposase-like protein
MIPPRKDLAPLFDDVATSITFLFEQGILYERPTCGRCRRPMTRNETRWRCTRSACRGPTKSIFHGSFFEQARLGPNQVLELAYYWICGVPSGALTTITGYSSATIAGYLRYLRELVAFNVKDTQGQIGGPGVVVEIDEAKFGKRKYNRGHRVEGAWVFGGVERTAERRVFAMVVPDRTADTLLTAIRERIHPESIIHSDMWRGYAGISSRLGMEHHTVNHSQNFLDPDTGVHTNTIEGTWNGLKIGIPIRHRTQDLLDDQLLVRIWRRDNVGNEWDAFLECLRNTAY